MALINQRSVRKEKQHDENTGIHFGSIARKTSEPMDKLSGQLIGCLGQD